MLWEPLQKWFPQPKSSQPLWRLLYYDFGGSPQNHNNEVIISLTLWGKLLGGNELCDQNLYLERELITRFQSEGITATTNTCRLGIMEPKPPTH